MKHKLYYNLLEIIEKQDEMICKLKQNTKGNPPTNATYWELQSNQTLVDDVEPFDNRITLWVNTSL